MLTLGLPKIMARKNSPPPIDLDDLPGHYIRRLQQIAVALFLHSSFFKRTANRSLDLFDRYSERMMSVDPMMVQAIGQPIVNYKTSFLILKLSDRSKIYHKIVLVWRITQISTSATDVKRTAFI